MSTLEISDPVLQRLVRLGGGLFGPQDVIVRLLDFYEEFKPEPGSVETSNRSASGGPESPPAASLARSVADVTKRRPRSRGAKVSLDGEEIYGRTVARLFKQVFERLLAGEKGDQLRGLIPYRTSNQRYLIAEGKDHPNGSYFWVPVQVGPYYVEAHKNYETAIKQLSELTHRLGVPFEYLG